MDRHWRYLALGAVVMLGGCATLPVGPTVMVLPGPGKTLEQFQADDAVCKQWAGQQAGTTPGAAAAQSTASAADAGTMQRRYDIAYQQCMYTKGHQIPGVPARYASPPLPPPSPPSSGGAPPSSPSPQPH